MLILLREVLMIEVEFSVVGLPVFWAGNLTRVLLAKKSVACWDTSVHIQ